MVRCAICCHFLCDFCSQGHRRGKGTMDHKLMTLEELKSRGPSALSKSATCRIHDGELLKMFCETCEETICRDCTLVDHRCVNMLRQTALGEVLKNYSSHLFRFSS